MNPHEWIDRALCATTWPDAPWVSDGRADPSLLSVCIHACPVRRECARTALQVADQHPAGLSGIWAGVSVRTSDRRGDAMAELRRIAESGSANAVA